MTNTILKTFLNFLKNSAKNDGVKIESVDVMSNITFTSTQVYSYMYKGSIRRLYSDCIINYILDHSDILSCYVDEVSIPAEEFKYLRPNKDRQPLKFPKGVTFLREQKKGGILNFQFSKSFIQRYQEDINKNCTVLPLSFILAALKSGNLGANGASFLIWFMRNQLKKDGASSSNKLVTTARRILKDAHFDTKHGYKAPLQRLQRYFDCLHNNQIINNPIKIKGLDSKIIIDFVNFKSGVRNNISPSSQQTCELDKVSLDLIEF